MSFKAMTWAVEQQTKNSGQKLVLLLLADHSNGDTGQCNPSHKRLAERCCMGLSTLKNHISELEACGFLSVVHKSVDGASLPNQYVLNIDGRVGQNLAEGRSESGRGVGQNLATNQEVKPGIKPKFEEDQNFIMFWKAYPRKINKAFASRAFSKMKVTPEMLTKMLQALEQQKRSIWKDKDQQYIPHASSWLKGERWEDEVPTVQLTPAEREKRRLGLS